MRSLLPTLTGRELLHAKLRTGGLTAEAFPTPLAVAEFLVGCADLEVGLKCTAGLHHAVRHTDAGDRLHPPRLPQRAAGRRARERRRRDRGRGRPSWPSPTPALLAERVKALTVEDTARTRDLFHGFGSCSFQEPVDDLVGPRVCCPDPPVRLTPAATTDAGAPYGPGRPRRRTAMTQPTWVPLPPQTDFPVENLPYGVATHGERPAHVVTRIGDFVVSLGALALNGLLDGTIEEPAAYFAIGTLNPFMALGAPAWAAVRGPAHRAVHRTRAPQGRRAVPGAARATWCCICRSRSPTTWTSTPPRTTPPTSAASSGRTPRPLLPNWKHLPIGYHGRAGTVVPSGTPIVRPSGQRKAPTDEEPALRAQRPPGHRGRGRLRRRHALAAGPRRCAWRTSPDHVFGVVLVNDWSARDIQAWEYVPLGPFLGKSFATSVSPWVVPLAALQDARVAPPYQDPVPLPYLQGETWGYDIDAGGRAQRQHRLHAAVRRRCTGPPAQQLAHMTVNGASLRTGDFYASGTVSGPLPEQRGSLHRADLERHRAAGARRRLDAHVPRRRRHGRDRRRRAGAERGADRVRRGGRDDPVGGAAAADVGAVQLM